MKKIRWMHAVLCLMLITSFMAIRAPFGYAGATASDSMIGFTYALKINQKITAYFKDASNIGSETEVVERRIASGGKEIVQKAPGRLKYCDITLQRGITNSLELVQWRRMVESGNVAQARSDVSILVLDRNFQPVATWNLKNCWPSKLVYNPPDAAVPASGNQIAIESIVLVSEETVRVK